MYLTKSDVVKFSQYCSKRLGSLAFETVATQFGDTTGQDEKVFANVASVVNTTQTIVKDIIGETSKEKTPNWCKAFDAVCDTYRAGMEDIREINRFC